MPSVDCTHSRRLVDVGPVVGLAIFSKRRRLFARWLSFLSLGHIARRITNCQVGFDLVCKVQGTSVLQAHLRPHSCSPSLLLLHDPTKLILSSLLTLAPALSWRRFPASFVWRLARICAVTRKQASYLFFLLVPHMAPESRLLGFLCWSCSAKKLTKAFLSFFFNFGTLSSSGQPRRTPCVI